MTKTTDQLAEGSRVLVGGKVKTVKAVTHGLRGKRHVWFAEGGDVKAFADTSWDLPKAVTR